MSDLSKDLDKGKQALTEVADVLSKDGDHLAETIKILSSLGKVASVASGVIGAIKVLTGNDDFSVIMRKLESISNQIDQGFKHLGDKTTAQFADAKVDKALDKIQNSYNYLTTYINDTDPTTMGNNTNLILTPN